MDLDALTPEHFEPLVGERFAVATEAGGVAGGGEPVPLQLELAAVERLLAHSHRSAPFSLAFRGPRQQLLPQRIYTLEHPRLGQLELFLVPIRGDAATVTYEAIFN